MDPRLAPFTLRYLAVLAAQDSDPRAALAREFDSSELIEPMVAVGFEPTHFLALISYLEAEGFLEITARAGEGVPYTQFRLTPEGVARGMRTGHMLAKALLVLATSLGVLGGPLTLVGNTLHLIDWDFSILNVWASWQERVVSPIQDLLLRFDVLLPSPWVVDYLVFGALVATALCSADRISASYLPKHRPDVPWTRRLFTSIAGSVFAALVWPLVLLGEFVPSALMLALYVFKRAELPAELRILHPPAVVIARFAVFHLPVFGFLALWGANALL
ncbi:MAG: hypothetical protein KDE27_20980 [Planctomycetes bacterium]|nr:hypothetical protein [Planctomycetota bacterium]